MIKFLAGPRFFVPFQKSLVWYGLCFKTVSQKKIQKFRQPINLVILFNLRYFLTAVAPNNYTLMCLSFYCFLLTNRRNKNNTRTQARNSNKFELSSLGWRIFQAFSKMPGCKAWALGKTAYSKTTN